MPIPSSSGGHPGSKRPPRSNGCYEISPATPQSKRDAQAASGGGGAALVGHRDALDRAEYRDVPAGVIVEAGTEHRADAAGLARRCEGQRLAHQQRADRGVAHPLQRNHAAMHVGLENVLAAKSSRLRHIELAALLEILQRAAADPQRLARAGFAVAVELAGEIAQSRGRVQPVTTPKPVAEAVGDLRADVPAVIAGGRGL